MSRPIVLTEKIKEQIKDEFLESLDKIKMADGKLSYSKSFKYEGSKAIVWITPEAYKKTLALVMDSSDEIGWHGTVSRSRSDKAEFIIEDIFVYPQEVTGSTVNTDQEAYTQWLYEFDDDAFDKIRMQGHSHVNMSCSPSGVDDKHRKQILEQLEDGMFYIFMIWNKSLSVHTLIYDMEQNLLYEDKDVTVKFLGDEDMTEFLADAKEKVQKPSGKKKKSRVEEKDQEEIDPDIMLEEYYSHSRYGLYYPYDL